MTRSVARGGAPLGPQRAARSLIVMFALGPTIGLALLVLPHSAGFRPYDVLGVILTGYAIVAWIALRGARMTVPEMTGLLVYGSVAVTGADLLSGSPSCPYVTLQIWPLLCAALYLPRVAMGLVVAVGVVGAGVVIHAADHTGDATMRWLILAVSKLVAVVTVRRAGQVIRGLLDRFEELSRHDPLTGLLNRRAFDDLLVRELDLAGRTGGIFSLALVDVDHFKPINDELGHTAGDAALKRVAAALSSGVRSTDDVFRIGGDEFAVILRGCEVEDAAEVLRTATARLGDEPPELTASVGIAMWPSHGDTASGLLRAADDALYGAKDSGRALVRCASGRGPGAAARAVSGALRR